METRSKTCRKCGDTKPISDFYVKSANSRQGRDYSASLAGYSGNCKSCDKQYAAEHRKRRGPEHALYMKDLDLRRKYGFGIERFNEMFAAQNGCCAICGRHQTEFVKGLAVDHDHSTGAIRQLLCPNCNVGLGAFRDNVVLLAEAIKYLETHAAAGGDGKPAASGKGAKNSAERDLGPVH